MVGYIKGTEGDTVMASKKKSRANNHKNKRKSVSNTSGVRGEMRRQHFEEGGTLAGWRGRSAVHTNRSEKRNDRSTVKQKAIRDSQEE